MNESLLTPPDVSVSMPRRVAVPATPSASPRKAPTARRAARGAAWKGSIFFIVGIVILSGGILFLMTQMRGGKSIGKRLMPVDIEAIR